MLRCRFFCALEDSAFKVSYSSAAILCLGFVSGAPSVSLGCVLECAVEAAWLFLG